jgi:putative Holliday junction resolvase
VFAAEVADYLAADGIAVRLVDERLTTVSAEAVLRSQGRKGKQRRAVVDQAAAVVMLQNALDTERGTGRPPGELVPPATEA